MRRFISEWKGVLIAAGILIAWFFTRSLVRPGKSGISNATLKEALSGARDARDKARKDVIWHETQAALGGLHGLSDSEFDAAVLAEYRRRNGNDSGPTVESPAGD